MERLTRNEKVERRGGDIPFGGRQIVRNAITGAPQLSLSG